jgi:hypothetical protein
MNDRRSLVDGLSATPADLPSKREREFVFIGPNRAQPAAEPARKPPRRSALTTRLRDDYVAALKRLSLERQLAGQYPNTLQDFLEAAIGDWLAGQGRLPE